MNRRALVAAAVGAVLATAAWLGARPASAQQESPASGSIELTALSPVVLPGGRLDATVGVVSQQAANELEVAFKIGPALSSRAGFEQAAAGKPSGTALAFTTRDVTGGPAGLQAALSVDVASTGRSGSDVVALSRPGVYPLTITLRGVDGGDELASLVTFVVRGDTEPPDAPFYVSWIWPLYAPPPSQPGDRASLIGGDLEQGGRIAVQASAAATSPVPISLWPVPATLDALAAGSGDGAEAAAVIGDLSRVAAAHGVIGGPYALAFSDAWALMPGELRTQLSAGAVSVAAALGVEADTNVAIAVGSRPTAQDLARLSKLQGAQVLVVPDDAVSAPNRKESLTRPFTVNGVPGVSVLRADASLAADLADKGGPVVAAQRLVADLTMVAQESPGKDPRGVVIRPDPSWAPTPALLAEATGRLSAATHLTVTELGRLAAAVPPATSRSGDDKDAPLVLETVASETAVPDEAAAQYGGINAARGHAAQLADLVTPGQDRPPPVLDEVAALLLEAPDSTLISSGQSPAYTAAVEEKYLSVVRGLSVPSESSLTLTSQRGKVPVTVRNDSPYTATVRVEMIPEVAVRTVGADYQVVTVEAGRSHTVEFEVAAAGAGSYRVLVRTTPPSGGDVISESSLELSVSAGSWVATALTIGSVAFLALWWLWHAWSRDRGGKHATRHLHPAGSGRTEQAVRPGDSPGSRAPARAR